MVAVSPGSLLVKASVGKLAGCHPGVLQAALPLVQGPEHKEVSRRGASLLGVNAQSKGTCPQWPGRVLCGHLLPFLPCGLVQPLIF